MRLEDKLAFIAIREGDKSVSLLIQDWADKHRKDYTKSHPEGNGSQEYLLSLKRSLEYNITKKYNSLRKK